METYDKYEKAGVQIESRYEKPHEYIIMAKAVKLIPIQLWHLIDKVWCDSKATYTYSLVFKKTVSQENASDLAHLFEACLMEVSDGHNGIYYGYDWLGESEEISSNWGEDTPKKPVKHTQNYWLYINRLSGEF